MKQGRAFLLAQKISHGKKLQGAGCDGYIDRLTLSNARFASSYSLIAMVQSS
jgi:hypothetical protein